MIYFISNNQINSKIIHNGSIELMFEILKDFEFIQVDTETFGFDPYTKDIICWQLGVKDYQFVIDQKSYPLENYKSFFENSKYTFLFQNAKFDLRFFFHKKIIITKVYDTYLAERMLNLGKNNVKYALDALVEKYTNFKLDKTIRGQIHYRGLDEIVIKYAAEDVMYLEDIMNFQLIIAENFELKKTISLQNKFCIVLAYTEYCGFYLNQTKWKKLLETNINKSIQLKNELDNHIKKSFPKYLNKQYNLFNSELSVSLNWDSPLQVINLFKDLGIDIYDKHNKESINANIIKKNKDKHELIPIYLEYKKINKLISTYGMNVIEKINPVTQRIHTQFFQILNTGRLSSGGKDKETNTEFINLQNIPKEKEIRSCFCAEPGNVIIGSDYSGQEQIVLANISKDKDLIDFYVNNLYEGDMHTYVATKLFPELEGLSLQEIKDNHSKKRNLAKNAGFAINYGGNGFTISYNLSIPIEEGEKVYNEYLRKFSGLKNYFNKVKKDAWEKGYIQHNDVDKTKLFFDLEYFETTKKLFTPEFWDIYKQDKQNNILDPDTKTLVKEYFQKKAQIERKALNYPIQGTSASITKIAGILFLHYLIENNLVFTVKICNFIHDEIVVECPENIAKTIAKKLKECMEKAGSYYCKIIPLKADPVISNHW